jgi:hypothetical protein
MGIAEMPLTKEEFEAAYVMWKCGVSPPEIAVALGYPERHTVDWCFIMRSAGTLEKYTVHYKDPN